jgi:hypothetical protein
MDRDGSGWILTDPKIRIRQDQRLALHYKFSSDNLVTIAPFPDFDIPFSKWQFFDDNMSKC